MTGSEMQSKTSAIKTNQLPMKGFRAQYVDHTTGKVFAITGMGDERYRLETLKRQPKQK